MKRIVIFFSTLFITLNTFGQVNETFSDGNNWTTRWSGNIDLFKVNDDEKLQSNAGTLTSAGTYYVSTSNTLTNNCEWDFWVNLNFSISGSNYVDVYLIANTDNLKTSSFTGYFVRVGGTNGPVSLYKRTGTASSSTALIAGVNGDVATNKPMKIKVVRNADNSWKMQFDKTGTGNAFTVTRTATADTSPILTSTNMGILITQSTATGPVNNHFFDDIYVGDIIPDTTPPIVTNTSVSETSKQIQVTFSEAVSPIDVTNFVLSNGFGEPALASLSADETIATLTFTDNFSPANYTLTLTGITDLEGNALETASTTQTFVILPLSTTRLSLNSLSEMKVTFSKTINSIATTNFSLSDGQIPTSATLAGDAKSVVLHFLNNLNYGTNYVLTMSDITDVGGNPLINPEYAFITPPFVDLVQENFSDGDFTNNPTWSGDVESFEIEDNMLKSNASTNNIFLSTPSSVATDCEWDFWVNLKFDTSDNNYTDIYLMSNRENLLATDITGYFVRIGSKDDNISLFKIVNGSTPTPIIQGVNKISNTTNNFLRIKVIRKTDNSWEIRYDPTGGTALIMGGTAAADASPILNSLYMGIKATLTSGNYTKVYFDDLYAGSIIPDTTPPTVQSAIVNTQNTKEVRVIFSEGVQSLTPTSFALLNGEFPVSVLLSTTIPAATLTFTNNFTPKQTYTITVINLTDLDGNIADPITFEFGVPEYPVVGDLIINEIMFNNPDEAEEYVEIYNKSDKILDVSGVLFGPKKSDGTISSKAILDGTIMMPYSYLALCKTPYIERNYFQCPDTANFTSMSFTALNNDGATIVLYKNSNIFDELTYSSKWHNPIVQDKKGVALERINPDLPTNEASSWTSAAADINYGTPGYKNSQHVNINPTTKPSKDFWLDNDVFTPNGDGEKDVLLIHYKLTEPNWTANISIFDATGQRIKKLHNNYTLSTEGTLTWDGSTDNEKLANIGIYVIYIEIFNMPKGETKKYKLPAVVSGKK